MTDELDNWIEATRIMREHKKPTLEEGRVLLPNSEEIVEAAKNHKLAWNP